MTMTESSPATETRVERRVFYDASPKTYGGGPLTAPRSPEDATALLSRVEQFVQKGQPTRDLLFELMRFLGANSGAWTPANRARLRRVLASIEGHGVVDAIVATIQRLPRTDVLDEAELVLRALPPQSLNHLRRMVEAPGLSPAVRACALRAAVRAAGGPAAVAYAALNDPDAEVRDSAVLLVAELGLAEGRPRLARRLEHEPNEMVRASIHEALASLDV